ncbi:hypothetical protein PVAG01_06215 [Phlyctema vagabunda]|uniref:Glycine zipper 2TM domain-containing protein n=1 Tax=Phlyctema vagabunda TaxID=108571 RepID=A0ABR4PFF1_9HELO
MDDFLELGIEGVDKLVDKKFHHVPDVALHSGTYHPRNVKKLTPRKLRRERGEERRRGGPGSTSSSEDSYTTDIGGNQHRASAGDVYNDRRTYTDARDRSARSQQAGPYSQDLPRIRPQYQPALENPYQERRYQSPPSMDGHYYPPAAGSRGRRDRGRDHDDDYYSDAAPRARPKAVTRRSNSLSHATPRSNLALTEKRLKQHQKRLSMEGDDRDGRRSNSGNGNDMSKRFTKTEAGLGAGVIGALVGGWATQKAQVVVGADKLDSSKRRNGSNALVTALGAAAAGLAANVLVDRWEDNKKKNKESDQKWDERFGKAGAGGGGEDDRSSGRGREHRRDRDSRSRRDSGHYLDERHGRGYESWDDRYD